jgi:hypothetical protein
MSKGRPPVKYRQPYLSPSAIDREPGGRPSRKIAGRQDPGVYFIGSGESAQIKVGFTTQTLHRLCELQVGSVEELKLLGLVRCATVADARKLERLLHGLLSTKGRHIRGEWFRLTVKEVDAIELALGLDIRRPENLRPSSFNPAASLEAAE